MYLSLVVVEGFCVVSFDLLANHSLQSNLVVLFIVVVVEGIEFVVVDGVGVDKVFVVDVDKVVDVEVVEVGRVVTVVVVDDVVDKEVVVGDGEVVLVVDDDGNVIALVDQLFVVAETSSSCHPNVGINVVSSSC